MTDYENRIKALRDSYSGELVGQWLRKAHQQGALELINELKEVFKKENNYAACSTIREFEELHKEELNDN